ncbi:MAG: STAS domain-containing protein [Bacillota bacterium]
MKINVDLHGDIKIIKLIGDLDGTTADECREEIMNHVESKTKLIFDMQECQYISSAGLRVLMIVAKRLKLEEAQGILANMQTEVQDVMEMTGFSHMLQSFDTLDMAIDFYTGESN